MRLLLVALVLVLGLALSCSVAYAQSVIPLGWKDTGVDLAIGRRYTIAMESHCVVGVGCAKAILAAGPVRIRMDGTHLTVWVGGDEQYDGDVGSEAITITIVVAWSGSGTVVLPDGSRVGFYLDRSYRITKYEEKVCSAFNIVCHSSRISISVQELPRPTTVTTVNPEQMPVEENPVEVNKSKIVLIAIAAGACVLGIALAMVFLRR